MRSFMLLSSLRPNSLQNLSSILRSLPKLPHSKTYTVRLRKVWETGTTFCQQALSTNGIRYFEFQRFKKSATVFGARPE